MNTDAHNPANSGAEAERIAVIIPALNEEASIANVLADIPRELHAIVIVADNGSVDRTAEVARNAGAIVVAQPERGYGAACLRGIAEAERHDPDIAVFLDADYSDHPEEMTALIAPIRSGSADMVIGSRALGKHDRGALLPQAMFGNWLATTLIRAFWGYRFTDLGPFRAIRWHTLRELRMADRNFGWTVEMQIKAAQHGVPSTEIPASYRKRIGHSKVTGTLKGTILAGYKILWTIGKAAFTSSRLTFWRTQN